MLPTFNFDPNYMRVYWVVLAFLFFLGEFIAWRNRPAGDFLTDSLRGLARLFGPEITIGLLAWFTVHIGKIFFMRVMNGG